MRVGVFGLGYVGAVIAGCLADMGHQVIAADTTQDKVDLVNAGTSPIAEPGLTEVIQRNVQAGRLRAMGAIEGDAQIVVCGSEVSIVCVGTPSGDDGDVRLDDLVRVCGEIGRGLRRSTTFHAVVISSTIPPGTTLSVVIPALEEASGRVLGVDFGVAMSPEFLREGSAISDFLDPSRVVIGASDERTGDLVASMYAGFDAPIVRTDLETAELVKLTDNAWHALKVAFANEIGRLAQRVGVEPAALAEIFLMDEKLNVSPRYLRPGSAFGGSCLPKDLRTLSFRARAAGLELPVVEAILPSNDLQLESGVERVLADGADRIAVLGLAFKANTDDLRESPALALTARLLEAGREVRVFDPIVQVGAIMGANLAALQRAVADPETVLLDSLESALEHAELVVVANDDPAFRSVADRLRPDQRIIDLVRPGRLGPVGVEAQA